MKTKQYSKNLLLLLGILLLLSFSSDIYSQKQVVVKKSQYKKTVVVKLPKGHKRVTVGKKQYYFHTGVFYKKNTRGFIKIAAPIGARITTLPRGNKRIVIRGVPYYYYYGTYYVFNRDLEVYEVVDPPEERNLKDEITLVTGEIYKGRFITGDENEIEFETRGEI